ncbi:helix-turn-helix domain-containing protein [Enhygromyxa salina]|uniref:HTH-type transcriptional regulator VirS n=1 Tax=Enhygromyxa salina TaxID=215803 RepID=A0A2S9YW79_9BACT|nr:AraC family transcriptional regulator [Enhygromyxa salina]PRQ09340.1 HTH-type transcriptional regulator VirS [Enhygromyxa salina]
MSAPPNPLSDGDIDTSNVRPAYEASLVFGATEAELEAALGWTRTQIETVGQSVSGASTHAHFELMYRKPRYAEFVLDAVRRHDASTLGIVGLACKTAPRVADALACHARFQHLTNRSARYSTEVTGERVVIIERRFGPASLGSVLLSDYAILVARQLLTTLSREPPPVLGARSRRACMPEAERERFEAFLGASITVGADAAALELDASFLSTPTAVADPELEAYFCGVLERVPPAPSPEARLIEDVRAAIRSRLVDGTPTLAQVARSLAIGTRTLQRRLVAHDTTFAAVLDSTRCRLAEAHLADSSLSLAEVAWLLGYVEQASFYRAFRRWHATTPEGWRRSATARS